MALSVSFAAALMIVGAFDGVESAKPSSSCPKLPLEGVEFEAAVNVFSDPHGAYGEFVDCPEIAFGIDFSGSDLSAPKHKSIVKKMRTSSISTREPMELSVKAYLRTVDQRRVLFITQIGRVLK